MDSVMLDFELNEQEKEKLKKMQIDVLRKRSETADKEIFATQFEISYKKVEKIYKNAHKRSLKYYPSHLDELAEGLKQEVKGLAMFIGTIEYTLKKNVKETLSPSQSQIEIYKNASKC